MELVNPNPKGRKGLKSLIYQQHISKHIIDRQYYTLISWLIGLYVWLDNLKGTLYCFGGNQNSNRTDREGDPQFVNIFAANGSTRKW